MILKGLKRLFQREKRNLSYTDTVFSGTGVIPNVVIIPSETDMKQLDKWKGDFGTDYTNRNIQTEEQIKQRSNLLASVLQGIAGYSMQPPSSFLEVGCGQGHNLQALKDIYDTLDIHDRTFKGVEPNYKAFKIASSQGFDVSNIDFMSFKTDKTYDMVFTMGVLIHIPADDLFAFMEKMYKLSNKYILIAEYFSADRRAIDYHGNFDMLWADDYGAYWIEKFKMACLFYGFSWKKLSGLDNLTWWVFAKVN